MENKIGKIFVSKGCHCANLSKDGGNCYKSVYIVNKGAKAELLTVSDSSEDIIERNVSLKLLDSAFDSVILIPLDQFQIMYKENGKQGKKRYAVYDVLNNDFMEHDTLEEAEICIIDTQDYIHSCEDGEIQLGEHIKMYKLVESISFVVDEEATKEQKRPMGMWQTKSC